MDKKRVYTFGNGNAEGRADMRNLLGGKGANLAEMNLIGVPVPPGFTITTEVCTEYYEIGKEKVVALLKDEVEKLSETGEREFKKAVKKLKVRFAESAETVSDIADTIGYYMTVCDNIELVEEYQKELENINLSEFKNLVKKYLPLDSAVVSVLMPEKKD